MMFLRKKYIIVLTHILLWAFLGFIYIALTPLSLGFDFPKEYWIKQPAVFALLIGFYYLNVCVLVPRLFYRQKLAKFICLHISIITLLMMGVGLYNEWVHLPEHMVRSIEGQFDGKMHINLNGLKFDTTLLLTYCLLIGISTSISITRIWQKDLLRSQQLLQKQLDSELSFLKAQIHPHFFFNTLNNIYSLTFTDVECSRASLHKLSRMMRYLIYETQNDRTSLHREINFVKDYIELMQLRVNEHTSVKFEEPGIITEKAIAPMMLLPFVENAFKHGVSSVTKSEILVKVRQQSNLLIFEVENSLFPDRKNEIDDGGIGLSNTKRRLDLIYAKHYQLQYGPKEEKYLVRLELEL
jgi:hypothetical protein